MLFFVFIIINFSSIYASTEIDLRYFFLKFFLKHVHTLIPVNLTGLSTNDETLMTTYNFEEVKCLPLWVTLYLT